MMLALEVQMVIQYKINGINKIQDAGKRLDDLIFTKQKIRESINDELDELFAKVELKNREKQDKKQLNKTINQLSLSYYFEDELQELKDKEILLDYLEQEIGNLYWYDAELVKLYMKFGNYRDIQKATGIPWISCYKTIKKAFDKIAKAAPI